MEIHQKSTLDSETIYTELMIPSYANFGGKIHGGILLSLLPSYAHPNTAANTA